MIFSLGWKAKILVVQLSREKGKLCTSKTQPGRALPVSLSTHTLGRKLGAKASLAQDLTGGTSGTRHQGSQQA